MNIEEVKRQIASAAELINAPKNLLPSYDRPRQDAHPYIEVDSLGYHFIISERFIELERRTTNDINDLIYWVLDGITHEMAVRKELKYRKEREDFRRQLFEIQVDLMEKVSIDYAKRLKKKISEILNVSPYDDSLYN
ncbi:MAG: Imm63 family immunity protein [Bacteroidota bacterium]